MLHARLLTVLAELRHTETLFIADAGLPIPSVVERIDLALVPSVPGFVETLRAVLGELAMSRPLWRRRWRRDRRTSMPRPRSCWTGGSCAPFPQRAEAADRQRSHTVRTGETTPFANVVLVAGVTF